jgi:hypothetical protein
MMLHDGAEYTPITTLTSITRSRRKAALMLMFAVSGVALLACTSDRASQDPRTNPRMDFPFLAFEIALRFPTSALTAGV